jgi:hypothetical protein
MTTTSDQAPVWQLPDLPDLPDEMLGEADDDAPAGQAAEAEETGPAAAEVTRATAEVTRAATRARMPGRTRRAGSTNLLLAVSALIALGGISFAVGRATSSAQAGTTQSTLAADGNPGFGGPAGSGAVGAATLSGTVVSVAADSFTLQLTNGQTVQVATGPSTTYHGQATAAGTDVTTGATVTVKTASGATAGSSAGIGTGASSGSLTGTRTATDVTITTK